MPRSALSLVAMLAGLIAAASVVHAQNPNPAVFEPVLVPISVHSVPGAYGSSWSTELWYRSNAAFPVPIFPVAISDFVPAVRRTAFLPIASRPGTSPGTVLYVQRNGGERVQFDLRMVNNSDPAANWGTRLPVVREKEFVESLDLINVPTDAAFRSALRIYSIVETPPADARVTVTITSNGTDEVLATAELPLTGGLPLFAQVASLADAFPQIRKSRTVTVHVQTSSVTVPIWAFASVTSNATQQVSIVTP